MLLNLLIINHIGAVRLWQCAVNVAIKVAGLIRSLDSIYEFYAVGGPFFFFISYLMK
jgi:hypothetical protein